MRPKCFIWTLTVMPIRILTLPQQLLIYLKSTRETCEFAGPNLWPGLRKLKQKLRRSGSLSQTNRNCNSFLFLVEMATYFWNLNSSFHRPRDSLFSWTSEFKDFTGLVNWGFLLLLMGGLRLFLENLIKYFMCSSLFYFLIDFFNWMFFRYGIRVDPVQWLIVLNGGSAEFQKFEYPSIFLLTCEQQNIVH